MKRIAILIDDITTVGGTERVASTIANKLSGRNDITIFSLNKKNEKPFYDINLGINLIVSDDKRHLFKTLSTAMKIKKMNFDRVVTFSMGRLSFEFCIILFILGVRNIYLSEHVSFESFPGWKRKLKTIAYKLAHKVGVLTDVDVKNLKANGIDHVTCLPNISPFEKIAYESKMTNYDSRENLVIAIGRMTYQKNFQAMIDIWSKINTEGWRLIIIGDGPDRNNLLDKIDKLSLKNIDLHPFSTNVMDYYNRARLILMTSRYEGLPMVLIEAQSFSIPIVAFDCQTGPSQIINNNENGFLVDNNDINSFSDLLQRFLSDRLIQHEMSIKSFENAERFTSEKIIPLWVDFLDI